MSEETVIDGLSQLMVVYAGFAAMLTIVETSPHDNLIVFTAFAVWLVVYFQFRSRN